jgi:hypothetical protein
MNDMAVVFLITLRHGIWRVTKDAVFYGDYRSRGTAVEGAESAAVALRRAGRIVKLVIVPPRKED